MVVAMTHGTHGDRDAPVVRLSWLERVLAKKAGIDPKQLEAEASEAVRQLAASNDRHAGDVVPDYFGRWLDRPDTIRKGKP